MWAMLLAWVPVAVMAGVVLRKNLLLAVVPLVVLAVVAFWRALTFRCPRCGERFDGGRGRTSWPSRTCRHCGIPMNTPNTA
jgi:hypothetical protein